MVWLILTITATGFGAGVYGGQQEFASADACVAALHRAEHDYGSGGICTTMEPVAVTAEQYNRMTPEQLADWGARFEKSIIASSWSKD